MEWTRVRIPTKLFAEISAIIDKHKVWINEHDFIREAIREKLAHSKEAKA